MYEKAVVSSGVENSFLDRGVSLNFQKCLELYFWQGLYLGNQRECLRLSRNNYFLARIPKTFFRFALGFFDKELLVEKSIFPPL